MPSDRISVRLGQAVIAQIDEYAEKHGLDRAIVVRLAVANQLGKKPPKDAKERFGGKVGNPNIREHSAEGVQARWGDKGNYSDG